MDLGAAQSPRGYVPDILKPPPRDVPLAAKDLGSLHIATIASSLLLVLTIPTTAAGPLDEPTCDRDEYTYNSNTYYRHTIRETCTVKWTNDEICTFYVYTYDYTAVNRGEDGWEEYGPYESETGACVSTPLPPPTSP